MYPLDVTHVVVASLEGWSSGQESILGSVRCGGTGLPQALGLFVSSQSDVLLHAWCQACVELCLLGREGPMLG